MQTLVDQTAQADQQRTARAFVGLFATALGVDQNYTGEDANPTNSNQSTNVIANPDGTFSIIGKPASNLQGTQGQGGAMSPALLLTLAVVAYLVLN